MPNTNAQYAQRENLGFSLIVAGVLCQVGSLVTWVAGATGGRNTVTEAAYVAILGLVLALAGAIVAWESVSRVAYVVYSGVFAALVSVPVWVLTRWYVALPLLIAGLMIAALGYFSLPTPHIRPEDADGRI